MSSSIIYPHFDPTPLLAGDHPVRFRDIVIASGANAVGTVLPRGSVLGEVGTTGTYILSVAAATDGSQTPKLISVADVDASTANVSSQGYSEGDFFDSKLTFGAGHSATTANAAFREATIDIYVRFAGTAA